MEVIQGEVVSIKKYGDRLYRIEIFSPYICKNAIPAQFVNIKCSDSLNTDPLLRRPFSIYETDKNFNVFSVLFAVKGKGTLFLCNRKKGDIIDFTGPLGNGFIPEKSKNNFLLVGGGIGVAPLYMIARNLIDKEKSVLFMAGFKDGTFYYWQRDIEKILRGSLLFTEDGSFGQRGTPAEHIRKNTGILKGRQVIVCGPVQMLIEFQNIFKNKNTDAYALLEEKMACGIGACFGCAVKVRSKNGSYQYMKVCSDGPVFRLGEVSFE